MWHRHFGVYGICLDEQSERLLVIRKAAGPYRGRYDLPGGSLDPQESLLEAITREFREETGLHVQVRKTIGTADVLVRFPFRETTHTHHIAVFYEVTPEEQAASAPVSQWLNKPNGTEANDSAGLTWVALDEFTDANTSPLVRLALRFVQEDVLSSEMERFEEWDAY
ncbi:NUDIX hydrolase [Tumebacillus flagellatus]|nr:NUDIX hydrolase [Tumebacillus flagellatus]